MKEILLITLGIVAGILFYYLCFKVRVKIKSKKPEQPEQPEPTTSPEREQEIRDLLEKRLQEAEKKYMEKLEGVKKQEAEYFESHKKYENILNTFKRGTKFNWMGVDFIVYKTYLPFGQIKSNSKGCTSVYRNYPAQYPNKRGLMKWDLLCKGYSTDIDFIISNNIPDNEWYVEMEIPYFEGREVCIVAVSTNPDFKEKVFNCEDFDLLVSGLYTYDKPLENPLYLEINS